MSDHEEIDAAIAYLEERLDILGRGIKVIGEHLEDMSDRLTILQMENDL
jgi:prefoldin subunit 5